MSRTQVSPPASIDREEPQQEKKKTKSRRPPNTAFRQQRLKAWQPILTPKSVLPLFFAIGLIFAPIGGLLLYASDKVQEIAIDYTDCGTKAPIGNYSSIDAARVSSSFNTESATNVRWMRDTINVPYGINIDYKVETNRCHIEFTIPNDMGAPVLFYYRLTKFYQNHRRYVKSLDQEQLEGHAQTNSTLKGSYCAPLALDATGKAYYPCGLIANSMFNDTFFSPTQVNANGQSTNYTYAMTNSKIAWGSDASLFGQTAYTNNEVVPPPNWYKRYPVYNSSFPIPNIKVWQEFQVWMRTAGLPTFSKLALRNDTAAMPAGTYVLAVYDDFPVSVYGGTKEILLSTRTVMGGKNPFLGIAYIVVGGLCIILGAVFLGMHLIRPRKLGDHTYLTWNNEPSTATASGRNLRANDNA